MGRTRADADAHVYLSFICRTPPLRIAIVRSLEPRHSTSDFQRARLHPPRRLLLHINASQRPNHFHCHSAILHYEIYHRGPYRRPLLSGCESITLVISSRPRRTKMETKSGQAGAPALANDNLFGGPVSNYNIQDMTWEIPISSERNVTVVGTIEDAIHHLQQVAPEVAEARFPSPSGPESNTALLSSASASLNTPRPKNVTCSQDHKKAVHWHIQTGVMYLRRLHSGPEMSPVCHSNSLNFSAIRSPGTALIANTLPE